jgi:hypothetical protein
VRHRAIVVLFVVLAVFAAHSVQAQTASLLPQPFQKTLSVDTVADTYSYALSFQVPAGKRLVIEHVSAHVSVRWAYLVGIELRTSLLGSLSKHFVFGSTDMLVEENHPRAVSTPLKAFADPKTEASAQVDFLKISTLSADFEGGKIEVTVVGYLVPAF